MKSSRRTMLVTVGALVVSAAIVFTMIKLFFVVLGGLAGDRFCSYQPVDAKGQPLSQWAETVERVHFIMRPFSTSIGSSTTLCLEITNESDKAVVVLGGQVLTYGRTIEAKVYDSPEGLLERTVPVGHSKVVGLYWQFGTWLDQVLGQEITWVWKVRIGKAEHSLRIPMQRK